MIGVCSLLSRILSFKNNNNIILTVEYYYAYSVGWYQIIKEERKEERGTLKKKKKRRRRRRRRRAFTTRSSLFHTTKVFVIKRYIQLVGVVGKRLDYAIFTGANQVRTQRLFNRTSQSPCLLLRPGQPRQLPARRHRHRHRHRRHRHRSLGTRSGWPNSL